MKKYILITLSLVLSSCAQSVPINTTFNPDNKNGLVAIGVNSDRYISLLTFSRMDPETCHLTAFAGVGNRGIDGKGTGKNFHMNTFPPGVWVLSTANYGPRVINKFDKGSIAFEVKPGEFIHIGELQIGMFGAAIKKSDPEGLAKFMEGFSNISAKPTTKKPWITPFSSNKAKAIASCKPRPA